ncbi:MAG: glyoxalase superfamily protein [Bacteroidota bacterium]
MEKLTTDTFEFKAIPTFRILDYQTAIDFYVDFLDFEIDWEHRFGPSDPVYMQISLNGLMLHLSENNRFRTDAVVFVDTKNIKAFHKELQERNPIRKIQEIERTPWQTLQLEIKDPFGNLLRFNENVRD